MRTIFSLFTACSLALAISTPTFAADELRFTIEFIELECEGDAPDLELAKKSSKIIGRQILSEHVQPIIPFDFSDSQKAGELRVKGSVVRRLGGTLTATINASWESSAKTSRLPDGRASGKFQSVTTAIDTSSGQTKTISTVSQESKNRKLTKFSVITICIDELK